MIGPTNRIVRLRFAIREEEALPQFPPAAIWALPCDPARYRMKLIGADNPSLLVVSDIADMMTGWLGQEELQWEFEPSARCRPDEMFAYLLADPEGRDCDAGAGGCGDRTV